MISSQIINQVWSSGVTSGAAGDAMTRAFRTTANVTPSDFDMSTPRFAGGPANITGGIKGGQSGEQGGEFMGRLFPYVGDIEWQEGYASVWCPKCDKMVLVGLIKIDGVKWTICKECLLVLYKDGLHSSVY